MEGSSDELLALRAERDALSERVSELQASLARAEERFDLFASTLPGISWESWDRPYEGLVNYVSSSAGVLTGYEPDEWLSRPGFCLSIMHPDDRARILQAAADSYARGDVSGTQDYRLLKKNGEVLDVHVRYSILRLPTGEPIAWQAFSLDVTAQRKAEAARDEAQARLIQAQADLLSELSTPLMPILDHVVAMPLVGRIDPQRAERVLEVLLDGVSRSRARFAILDITGVPAVDREIARVLLRAARATRLLGVKMVLTGVRPEVARALCAFDEKLDDMVTLATLQAGVAYVLKKESAR
jgi:rsbT co-antagonist protein RsbR